VGLDVAGRQFLLDHVRRLCRERRIAVLWATHLIDEVGDGDDVVVLHNGRVLAKGAISSVVAAARTPDIGSAFTKLTQTEIDNAAEAGS
jgi:ABC-2 type transport system ATP-binding protein